MSLSDNIGVGISVDAHRFTMDPSNGAGRPLVLGGVRVPFDKTLDAHSDGDVLLHAIMDAVLSAADLPDLGTMFPATEENRNRSSVDMAQEVTRHLNVARARILSIDSVLLAQNPKISELRGQLRESIAACFDIPMSRINIKGKTLDHMGPTGREEGIEARAVALVERGYTASCTAGASREVPRTTP